MSDQNETFYKNPKADKKYKVFPIDAEKKPGINNMYHENNSGMSHIIHETSIKSISFYRHYDERKKGICTLFIRMEIMDSEKFVADIKCPSPSVITGNFFVLTVNFEFFNINIQG